MCDITYNNEYLIASLIGSYVECEAILGDVINAERTGLARRGSSSANKWINGIILWAIETILIACEDCKGIFSGTLQIICFEVIFLGVINNNTITDSVTLFVSLLSLRNCVESAF